MSDEKKTKRQLIAELEELRRRVAAIGLLAEQGDQRGDEHPGSAGAVAYAAFHGDSKLGEGAVVFRDLEQRVVAEPSVASRHEENPAPAGPFTLGADLA